MSETLRETIERLANRADAREDVNRRLVTTTALRAALADHPATPAEDVAKLVEPWGPFDMGGFEGCTDRDSNHCACATDQQPTCELCGQEIDPGERTWARQWPCYNTLPLAHPDQDWDTICWHDECPGSPIATPAEEAAEVAEGEREALTLTAGEWSILRRGTAYQVEALIAALTAKARAEAWDEGWTAGCNDQQYGDENAQPWTPNPYREASA